MALIENQTMKNKTSSRTFMRNLVSGPDALSTRFPGLWCPTALTVLGVCFLAVSLPGQAPRTPPVSATITFANRGSVTMGSNDQQIFSPVTILPGEALSIQLQLPSRFVRTPLSIQPLDGGHAPDELLVAADGTAAFVFQSGTQPGLYRIMLAAAGTSVLLQFIVPNPGKP